jgi:hypothetical protein
MNPYYGFQQDVYCFLFTLSSAVLSSKLIGLRVFQN